MTTVTTSAVLRAEALGWSVDGKTILSGVSVDVRPQMMTMIIGLNGSGKTTLLHLLAGLRKPGMGRVWLGKRDLARIGAKERSRMMALLEQNPSAHVELTVRDVVQLGRIPHLGRWRMGNLSRRQGHDDDVVEKAMATTGSPSLLIGHGLPCQEERGNGYSWLVPWHRSPRSYSLTSRQITLTCHTRSTSWSGSEDSA